MPPLRVLIADDHQLFAETLGLTLDFDERVEVAGSARERQGGRAPRARAAARRRADGSRDAGARRLHATRLLRRLLPACPVVVLTASLSPEDAHRARTAGAAAYLNKGCSAEHVVAAPARGRDLCFVAR